VQYYKIIITRQLLILNKMELLQIIIIITLINITCCVELHTCPDTENDPHVKIIRIPEKLDCNNLELTGEVFKVNEYSINQNTYVTESFLISIAKLTCTTEFKIFRGYTTIKDVEYITLTYNEYLKINKTLSYKTHDDKTISLIANDNNPKIYQNKDSGYKCERNLFSTIVVINYEITLTRNNLYEKNGMMKSPMVPVYSCTYSNKICHINDNILVWNVNNDYNKAYIEVKTNLTMFLLKDSVSNIYHMISKEFKIGYTISNMSDVVTDSSCQDCIKTDNPLIVIKIDIVNNTRTKRNVPQFNQYDNIKFGIFYNRIDNICKLINYNYAFWLESCRTDPISCAKIYANVSEIKAVLINNYLMIYQCTRATIIAFRPRKMKDGRCSALIPIKFENEHDNEINNGYLDPITLEIYNNTILYEDQNGCKSHIIFTIGSVLYVYYSDTGNHTIITNIYKIEHLDIISNNTETTNPRPIPHANINDYIHTNMIVTNMKKHNEEVYVIIIAIILIIFGIAIYLASTYRNKKNYNKLNTRISKNEI
jgi:hypothetical protein